MVITDIFKKQGTRYQIEVDGAYWTIIDVEIIADFHLKKGMEVTEEMQEKVQRAADYRRGKERALYLLGYRDHCRKDLVDKLSKNIDRDLAEEIADKMEELGFLDDRKYAEKLARHLILVKKRGERRALQEMALKGIDRETAVEAISLVEPDENLLQQLIERKYLRYLGDEKGRNKVIAALMRLGHDYGDVIQAVDEAQASLKEE